MGPIEDGDGFGDRDNRQDGRQSPLRRDRREEWQHRVTVITLFERLGYDLSDNEDVQRLNENLRFIEKQRKRQERMDTNRVTWLVSLALVVIGAALSALVNWISTRIGTAHG